MTARDPQTGASLLPYRVNIALTDRMLPVMYRFENWGAVADFLGGPDFRRLDGRIHFVTIMPPKR